ncbi:PepSY domain-containing protein [Mesorhizobium sp. BAC0120]|uniref:PepSY domain-containing protein n=1 Tax=Mesorhizobium sp. BAC0120 TaxID=3090670 RepID=UPI00298D0552|nr:PepSY domain-containing protein [Mesorhizobium sp. BAC0120]MDW6024785.1 PepSY domain-containing protein [Mesorhizobium sp. BAC0120]
MRTLISTLALLAVVAGIGSASAEDKHKCGNAAESQWMSKDAIKAKFGADGTKVRQVKVEGGCYEVYAVTKDGAKVEKLVNPVTGEVVGGEDEEG